MPRYREEGQREQSNSRDIRDFAQVHEDHLNHQPGSKNSANLYNRPFFTKHHIAFVDL
jgi:hypothetical protein